MPVWLQTQILDVSPRKCSWIFHYQNNTWNQFDMINQIFYINRHCISINHRIIDQLKLYINWNIKNNKINCMKKIYNIFFYSWNSLVIYAYSLVKSMKYAFKRWNQEITELFKISWNTSRVKIDPGSRELNVWINVWLKYISQSVILLEMLPHC